TLTALGDHLGKSTLEIQSSIDIATDEFEKALMDYYKPHLNVKDKIHSNPLPDRYIKRIVANKGVKLG
ncbi:MAG: hypothetical protein J2P36_26140, partial [Ktedonobacteraceae bacterium]|nr:hypothetical protein [Ktedonobacteraceae bacterium]